jgi:NTP pyrophosphatase (non-canonical NTP hydrolase)
MAAYFPNLNPPPTGSITEARRGAGSQRNENTENMDLNKLSKTVNKANEKWWIDIETGEPIERNKGELLCLIHSEISEAMEGERKDLMDDKLPHRKMAEVELADAMIRILDYCGGFGYDLQGAFDEKMDFNAQRTDHTHEARRQAGGKKF